MKDRKEIEPYMAYKPTQIYNVLKDLSRKQGYKISTRHNKIKIPLHLLTNATYDNENQKICGSQEEIGCFLTKKFKLVLKIVVICSKIVQFLGISA